MTSPLLVGLNEPQQQAVLHDSGPVLIFAGAGSGKTNALTKRIAYLIRERQIRPYNILAVTFTNKAAAEMKERIARLVGDLAMRDLWAGTFHSLCARVLRERGVQIGLDKNFVIYDGGDQISLVKESIRDLDLDDKQYAPRAMLAMISKAKETLQKPDDIINDYTSSPFERAVGSVYRAYQEKLTLANALDFDDLIMKTGQLLRESEKAREHYQSRFHYVHCDEFQDVNDSQYQLLTLFAGKHKNICVVGDDDQCVVEGTPILTPTGYVPVEQIQEGDTVLAACGGEYLASATVDKVTVNDYTGLVRHIHTDYAGEVCVTPNHIMFGDKPWESVTTTEPSVIFDMFPDYKAWAPVSSGRSKPSFAVTTGGRSRDQDYKEALFSDYNDAWHYAKQLQSRLGYSSVKTTAYFVGGLAGTYSAEAAATFTEKHSIPVVVEANELPKQGKVVDSPICAITDEEYTGKVYD
ncbi:MAG: UvrD-helicase domain-containing protein, partial [Armatimonadota bacterium]|nr:UvrD-helicase domain-containing protein [Armatimonadota bacterium]